jgi:hypothetical protein
LIVGDAVHQPHHLAGRRFKVKHSPSLSLDQRRRTASPQPLDEVLDKASRPTASRPVGTRPAINAITFR